MGTFLMILNEIFLIELLLLLSSGQVLGASFYGDGYVQLKTVELSSRTSLHVRFRTSSHSGLLFLAAGEMDFLLVELHSSRLQVRLDLGSGERTLRSEKGVHLNDMAWHSVQLQHEQHNVTLTVDHHAHTSIRIPGPDLELSVHDGLFVGGTVGLNKTYLHYHNTTGFRGCVDEVIFNQHNLLSSLRPYSGYKSVHEVSLGCSPQFSAGMEDPISFFSSRAYMLLPPWNIPQEGVLEYEVHTSYGDGIIVYSSAHHGEFVAMEIREGRLIVVIGNGGTRTELRSLTYVNNQRWHRVKLHLLSNSMQLTVGEEIVNHSLEAHPKALKLQGPLYIGGVDDRTRLDARNLGLLSFNGKRLAGGGSFKGCLKDITVNSQRMGPLHALVTKDISVGCEPAKQVITILSPTLVPSFTLPATHHRGSDKDRKRPGLNFVVLKDLEVLEGGRAPLESKHIRVNLDFQKLGILQSQMMFRIEEQPVHGQLRIDMDDSDQEEDWTFSMLDLSHGRVMYVHGGSEDPQDFFMFSVFTNSKKNIPFYLKGNKLHRFNISVTPVNDPPELSLPEGSLFTLLENSKRQLDVDVLRATDSDSNTTDLVFTILGNHNAGAGFLENNELPGMAITTFSQHDLEEGKISYVHTGELVKNSRIALRVSDGDKVSNTVVLRIMAVQLEHKVANNTGVEVNQGGAAIISSKHLAMEVNIVKHSFDIRFDVVEAPRYGELQRLHSSGDWKTTSVFSQKLLEKERIRYINTFQGIKTNNVTDQFKCKVSIGSTVTDELVFLITVRWIHFKITRNKIEVSGVRNVVLSNEELRVVSKGFKLPDGELYFRMLTLPKKGHLVFNNKVLKINSTFSQKNISDHMVKYEVTDRPHEDARDSFRFQVFSKQAHSGGHEFRIYIKADVHSLILTNKGLSIHEGESRVITKDRLFAGTVSTKAVHYTIKSSPKHGKLKRINLSNSTSINDNVMSFTNQDILEERIMYVHDDSESTEDVFTFHATLYEDTKELNHKRSKKENTHSVDDVFKVTIALVNDEKPVRIVDKVFHVARDGQRLLTLDFLCYHDADSDFDDRQLLYTRRGIPMGDLVLVNDTGHRLYQFSQDDLHHRRVLFIHRGVSSGRFVLFVSDGKHYTSTLLDVVAQDPYIKVENNTGLLVQKGQAVTLRSANLSIFTNLDVREDEEVVYQVFLPPSHGALYNNNVKVNRFTQRDLKAGHLEYLHDNSRNLADSFNFTVSVKEVRLDASVAVRVYLESHQLPPTVQYNHILVVEEGKPVKIKQGDLEVTHKDNLPSDIVFTVTTAPSHGFLRRSFHGEDHYKGTREDPIHSFSQEDINTGHIQYLQVDQDQTYDFFVLDASNGITEVHDIRVSVDVIPNHIPLRVFNVTLGEGSSVALTNEVVQVNNRHFSELNIFYNVSQPPCHGHIEHARIHGVAIPSFTRKQVNAGHIYYVHDGSDTLADNFTITANDTDVQKYSRPCTVFVSVMPVNDEAPVITANRILRVWVNSVTEISVDDLSSEDNDSPPEDLEFIVTPPSNGYLALKSAPTRHILNFTQTHILRGQLVFVHSGALSGGFHFQVNDGVNFAPRQIFSTIAHSLVLILERKHTLQVFPGSLKTISQNDLLVVTNDNGDVRRNQTIVYSVTSPPKLGKLVRKQTDNSTLKISSFTQNMVNKGLICYDQTDLDSVGWSVTDSFTFTVSSPPASLPSHVFSIHISYEHAPAESNTILTANTGAVVTEGGRVMIDKMKLDASNLLGKLLEAQRQNYEVWYHVISLPQHGIITVGERNLTRTKPNFSQFILDRYGITYQHDDSETTQDFFTFEVWLNQKGQPPQRPSDPSLIVTESFDLTVNPVNDQPPQLLTLTPSLRLVQGDTVVFSPENLKVEDLDNPPSEILYKVISKPNSGHLALGEHLNETVSAFTQADIDEGRVHFIQEGEPSSGVFYFSVSDGFHRPLYKLFNLEVTAATVTMVNNTGVELVQGQTTAALTTEHLAAETNGRKSVTIHYTVTAAPQRGRLLMSDLPVSEFNQEDLHSGRLSYHMTDLTSSSDRFEFTVSTPDSNLTAQTVNITVRPLIHLGERVLIPSGIAVKLRKDALDATELARLSGSDPVFYILSPPKHGKLVKVTFNFSDEASHFAESFTFRDVVQGRVALEETLLTNVYGSNTTDQSTSLLSQLDNNKTDVHISMLNDSFKFLLKADNVQPAVGEFLFTIVPYEESLNHTTGSPGRNRTMGGRVTHSHTTNRKKNLQKQFKDSHQWDNETRRGHPMIPTVPRSTHAKHDHHGPHRNTPVRVETLPRPASDPLLLILPFLACLLLIVILVGLILVLRHRREKRALSRGLRVPERSPYLGRPERSITVPSVVVTPLLGPNSCPSSPILNELRRGTLAPHDPCLLLWAVDEVPDIDHPCRSPSSLKDNQYWV
ncbi:chondroitin sulfate proteoglycan 4 isoform X2 [Esox lucius]|uniref:chondroitin sulfate proteoglycan 4 isoform X2 n=1 Tax=Esox lucius TaxID=8010 RepID=UPI0014774194|nr:chondroitin sulfate proteoglycan 4 isoform X2 [Esox lucius]